MANYFKSNENQYFRKIWDNMKKNNVKSLSEGVKKVRSGYVPLGLNQEMPAQKFLIYNYYIRIIRIII